LASVLAARVFAQQAATADAERVTIAQAVSEALDHNLRLLAERYNVSIADTRIITARLRPNPVFTFGADYNDILGSGFYNNPSNGAGPPEVNFRVDYVLERGGKRRDRIEVAATAREVAQLGVLSATRSLVLEVQNAFVEVQQARENLALAQENLKVFQGIVAVNSDRVRAGDLGKVELVRTQVAALQFRNSVRQAELRLRTARNRLQTLMGRTTFSDSFEAIGDLRRDAPAPTSEVLLQRAFEMRPELQALNRDQARSVADLRLQIAQGKVDYTVGTMYHRQYGYASGSAMGFFFSAPLPVFNRNQGEIERVRQEQRQIEARIHALQNDIRAEVQNAYQQHLTARDLLESIERDMLAEARDVRETTEYSYRRGEASLIELLDAQRAFNDTVQGYNEARAEYARSLYLIDSISGQAVNR
jgi:cobalt-zinc-cadmium efflux system outer membrane protein